ncbi:MAG: putative Ig domain-containing protein, partial [Verrucomicrobiota bacterium]
VDATDDNQDPLTYSLTNAPVGMTIDPTNGLIQWTPTAADLGAHPVDIVVTDPLGASASQSYTLVVRFDSAVAPVVDTVPDQMVEAPQLFITINLDNIVADPDHLDSEITWTVTGANELNVSISPSRIATITYTPGARVTEAITFIATDPAGFSDFVTVNFTVRGADNPPIALIANLDPQETTLVRDGLFNLLGAADDPDLVDEVSYKISLYDPQGTFVRDLTPRPINPEGFYEGRVSPTNLLGELDFTLTRNGVYDLFLDVKGGEQIASASARIALNSELKVGQFGFSQQDVTIPVNGIPLTVVRTYNSLNTSYGDFGFGWTYSINELEIEMDETRIDTLDLFGNPFSLRNGGSRNITLTMPDTGRRVTFIYELLPAGFAAQQANWKAPPGSYATLRPVGSNRLLTFSFFNPVLTYWEQAGPTVALENFDFPRFILTTRDGTQYLIERKDEGEHFLATATSERDRFAHAYSDLFVSRITTRNGDRLEFVREENALTAIDHYNALGQKTKSLLFQRNTNGRIETIYDPANVSAEGAPNGPHTMRYEYDGLGNLTCALKLVDDSDPGNLLYEKITYVYEHPQFPHYITDIKDPTGTPTIRTEYDDDGRMVATIDAFGNRIDIKHDISARTETLFDSAGNPTTLLYNDRGNVTMAVNPLGFATRFIYDENDNEISVMDPLGNTHQTSYDASGNLLTITDPLTNTASFTYDAFGNSITDTDASGLVSTNTFPPEICPPRL